MNPIFNRARILFLAVGLTALTLDLASKTIVFMSLGEGERVEVIPNFFFLDRALNTGGMWSFGADNPWTNKLLGLFSCVVVAVLVGYVFMFLKSNQRVLGFVFGMMFGGALGNLHDRARIGSVRDFLTFHFPWWGYTFPTFNLADSFLVCSVAYLFVAGVLFPPPEGESKSTTSSTKTAGST